MRIVGLDLETTGFKYDKGDRIIEIAMGLYDLEDGVLRHVKDVTKRINPQRSIPIESQRVHGISLEDLRDMPVWDQIAAEVKEILDDCDVLVIHNADFDYPFIKAEQAGAGYTTKAMQVFCTMDNARWATFDGKRPSLGELAWSLGVRYDTAKAHGAMYDVEVTMECFAKGLELGLYQLPKGDNNG